METDRNSEDMSEEVDDCTVEPGLSEGDRKTWELTSASFGAVLVLHGLAYYLLPGWLWGAGTLHPLGGVSAAALLLLGALSLVPGVALPVAAALARAWDSRPLWFLRDAVGMVVSAGTIAVILFWKLGVQDPVANAWLFHAPYTQAMGEAPSPAHSMPALVHLAASGLSKALDVSNAQAVRGMAVALGAALCCAMSLIPIRRETGARPAAGFLLALSGASLIFISPRADLALEAFAAAAFVVLGVASRDRGISPIWAGIPAVCAAVAHPIGFPLLPAWAFLVWRRGRAPVRALWLSLIGAVAVTVAALAVIDLALGDAFQQLGGVVRSLWLSGSGTGAGWVLRWAGEGAAPSSFLGALGWLLERVWGTVNGLLLTAPVGLALAAVAVVRGGWRAGSPTLAFLGFAAAVACIFAFAAAPYQGPPRTWGIYGPAGIFLTAFGAWWLIEQFPRGRRFKALALSAVVISLIHLLPPLFASKHVGYGAVRLGELASAPSPWDTRGRAAALEGLGAFRLTTGDTLSAAAQLTDAWEVWRDPLYLGTAGTYYVGMKRYGLAEQAFAALVEARPYDSEANLSLGIIHALQGDYAAAKAYFLVAYGDTSLTLPEPEFDTDEWVDWPHGPERQRARETRMEMRKNSQETFQQGEKAADRGDLQMAERLYKRALEIYPLWGRMQYEVHYHLGTLYAMQGRTREAAYEYLLGINSYRNYPLCYFVANGVGYGPTRRYAAGTP